MEFARSAMEAQVLGEPVPESAGPHLFGELRGVFVTINRANGGSNRLRGCIGFPYPVKQLGEAIREASMAAASEDPRFPPVGSGELDSVVVEVSILSAPRPINSVPRTDLPSKVRIGEDGLIVSNRFTSGLLLPQVASEHKMGQTEFLAQACMKADLPPDAWLDPETTVQVFQAEVFGERVPRGEISRVRT